MPSEPVFRIRYWGATGSFPNPLTPDEVLDKIVQSICRLQRTDALQGIAVGRANEDAIRELVIEHVPYAIRSTYGGNTTCVELETPDALIILDAGSGFRRLGMMLNSTWNEPDYDGSREAHVVLTHAHFDHTSAMPFVDPYYDAQNRFKIWAPQSVLDSLHKLFSPRSELRTVYFPPTYEMMSGIKSFEAIRAGQEFWIGETRVTTLALNHPGECLGYRFEHSGRAFVFATDHENAGSADRRLARFADGADLLYLDAQYLADEYEGREGIGHDQPASREGWGHSTMEASVDTAVAAGVKRLHLAHHDPKRDDQHLAFLLHLAQQRAWEHRKSDVSLEMQVDLAREGLEVHL